ncbi:MULTISPECIES: hypothetical protein [Streptomyces]|uniref:HEAT repeat domain-containing protein n=1 Tax=Streptomyces venezuelae (strain ATCC 10712 / CBS 650.69 / DSM 40230 / JCM 4526 / NBRC 13096 / PD 04745) TaxID=953739 RepID=F2RF27_STRVP|nr:hypothetical protein [Streptomyces venezuelae]APE25149.1 hypothetical protein vnz_31700 [Streptomyces venezuelae]QES02491.1 hypothetical protein DEJ43_32205 [Streptomyces venezuelae ATCC 10712]QES09478.1 hypothetical protein DEJ44_30155 [Streptomyces venezuelae]QES11865.1 hypothetical protein DEJ45_05295 [Streptomyces venezuelae]CCA59712.1 hypothetical protein SVEN_6426 [Streptomyces venezuelae ATCC 10712]
MTDLLTRLTEMLDDLDADVDETIDLADEIAASGDAALLPRLQAELDRALTERNAYARELLGGVLAAIGGPDALPTLIRASAVDLGDDQDGLATEIVDLVQADPKAARGLLQPLTEDDDLSVANRADWALRFLP